MLPFSAPLCDNSSRQIPGSQPQTTASHNPQKMPGQLFTNYFLEEGILHTAAWQESLSQPADLDTFRTQALTLLQKAANFHTINEASTEMELIRPLFKLLGWNHYLPQQGSDQNQDIPDHLLFGDANSKDNAVNKPAAARYPDALYFHLYGLSRADAAYILDTFPIVRRHDKAAFGTYRTKHMVLAYYNALAAGDTNSDVAL